MLLTFLMLLIALCLSGVAAFYSIMGLTAIFAAAVMPIVIMGTMLEAAKLIVTVWLHEYWDRCRLLMKVYLVPAVALLMMITSMGIFGFLSKAHLDQAVPAGDISAQVQIFDDKIKTQKDNIEANRRALKQMDDAVDQTMGRTTDDKGAERAVQIRRTQAKERGRLQDEIARAQSTIVKLQEERAPIASQARKVEAEVGPIKYIAALIYGDNPDATLLERAVRWVIIILVIVFDPLAIMMLLAVTESYKWERERRRGENIQESVDPPKQPINDALESARDKITGVWAKWRNKDATPTKDLDGLDSGPDLGVQPAPTVVAPPPPKPVEYQILDEEELVDYPPTYIQNPEFKFTPPEPEVDDDDEDGITTIERQARQLWKIDNPNKTLKEQRRLLDTGKIDRLPWEEYLNDPRIVHDVNFGTTLPDTGVKGDIFVVTAALPTRLYKYNGDTWIEVDKTNSDSYAYNHAYIDHLIGKISSGEYDPELLTDSEREQIELRLKQEIK